MSASLPLWQACNVWVSTVAARWLRPGTAGPLLSRGALRGTGFWPSGHAVNMGCQAGFLNPVLSGSGQILVASGREALSLHTRWGAALSLNPALPPFPRPPVSPSPDSGIPRRILHVLYTDCIRQCSGPLYVVSMCLCPSTRWCIPVCPGVGCGLGRAPVDPALQPRGMPLFVANLGSDGAAGDGKPHQLVTVSMSCWGAGGGTLWPSGSRGGQGHHS